MTVPEENQKILNQQDKKIDKLIEQVRFITENMIVEVNKTINLKKQSNENIKRQLKELYDHTNLIHQKLYYVTKTNQIQMDQIKVDIISVINHINKISSEELSIELQDILTRNKMFIDKLDGLNNG